MPRNYETILKADNEDSRKKSMLARDIANLYPPVGNIARRDSCRDKLITYLETYHSITFTFDWADDHRKVIGILEDVIMHGGKNALAMPRGSGKTSIVIRATIWALLYGHRRFISLIGVSARKAKELMIQLQTELSTNLLLLEDFPNVCYPIARLENNAKRCIGQLFNGQQTRTVWGVEELVFATMPDSACYHGKNVSGATVRTAGIEAAIRGQLHTLASGEAVRPDLAILDDPQDRESANSPAQTTKREDTIMGDVLQLAGPGKTMACVMPCTVIYRGDLADRFLDRNRHPDWKGDICKALYKFPKNMTLWQQYYTRKCEKGSCDATEWYRQNQVVMDEGAVVAWEDRYDRACEASGLQAMMNIYFSKPEMFLAEFQNTPIAGTDADSPVVDKPVILKKLNNYARGVVPRWASHVVIHIDIQKSVLFYTAVAFSHRFDGAVIDYGTYPEQKRRQFSLHNLAATMADAGPKGAGEDGVIFAGLRTLTGILAPRPWAREDGVVLRAERILIDCGYKPGIVGQVIHQSPFGAILMASRGEGITAARKPISEYRRDQGAKIGDGWWIPVVKNKADIRYVMIDTNQWKTFMHRRLGTAFGDVGCLSLWGSDSNEHELFADHLTAETSTRTTGHGREVDEYRQTPGRDNHWLDNIAGCCVAASMCGCQLPANTDQIRCMSPPPPRKGGGVKYI